MKMGQMEGLLQTACYRTKDESKVIVGDRRIVKIAFLSFKPVWLLRVHGRKRFSIYHKAMGINWKRRLRGSGGSLRYLLILTMLIIKTNHCLISYFEFAAPPTSSYCNCDF